MCIKVHSQHEKLNINIGSTSIEQVQNMKYLEIHLDPYLTFESHNNKPISKVSSKVNLLWRIRSHINHNLAKTLCQLLIQPHFTYGDFLMKGITQKLNKALQVQHNSTVKAVKNVELGYPTGMIYAELHLDRLEILYSKAAVK